MESKIVKTVIYQNQALVTRQVVLDLKPGLNSILFENIPPSIDKDSLRIKVIGKGQIKLNGIELVEVFLEKASNEEIQKIKTELLEIKDKIDILNRQNQLLASQDAFIQSLKSKIPDEMITDLNYQIIQVSEIEKTYQKSLTESLELIEKKQKKKLELEELFIKKNTLEQKLNEIKQGSHTSVLNA